MVTSETQIEEARKQLLSDLYRVAKQAESRLRFQALLYWLLAVTAVIAGLLMLDCLFQREEVGLRWLSWTALLATSIYAAYRWLRPLRELRVLPLDVAQWVESRQPEWSGRISTALQLAEIDNKDHRFGSLSFREATLAQWQAQPAKPQWDELISNERLKRSMAILALIASSIFLLVALWPELGMHALKRLLVPWSNEQWPRADQLEIANLPTAVGQDSVVQLEVRDRRPPLPEDVTIELRYSDTVDASVITIPTQRVADLAVASLPPILQEIQVRAVGGDDRQMPWQTIRVVEVPGWKQYKFQIQPPEYIRQSPSSMQRLTSTTVNSDGVYELIGQRITILAGSHVRFTGELALPVRDISMQPIWALPSDSEAARGSVQKKPAELPWRFQLSSDQVSVSTVSIGSASSADQASQSAAQAANSSATAQSAPAGYTWVNQSLAWAVRMGTFDEVMLESPNHWKIEVLSDNAPEVMLESPQLKSLTLGAPLPLQAVARDDWGLRSLVAKLTIGFESEIEYELPIQVAPMDTREQVIQQTWDFAAQLASQGVQLKPQEQISIWIEAVDLSGKSSKSNIERISLESKQRQLESVAGRQNALSESLSELLAAQESALELAQRTVQNWQDKTPTQQHLDALSSVHQLQQTIRQQLIDSPRSLQAEIDRLLQLVADNQLDDTQLAKQLKQLQEQVIEIGNNSASSASKSSGNLQTELAKAIDSGDKSNLSSLASELDRWQTQTKAQLGALVDQMDDSESKNKLREKLLEIAQRQEQLTIDTNQLNVQSLQKAPADFTERLALSSLTQTELTTKTEQWLSEVLQLTDKEQLATVQQLVGQLQEAARVLVDAQVIGLMRSSGGNLNAERLGVAVQQQKQIQQAFNEALSQLGQTDSSELLDSLATQEQRLRVLSDRARQLAQQQMQLAKDFSDPQSSSQSQALASEQTKSEQATSQLLSEMNSDDPIGDTIREAQQLQQQAALAAENQSMAQAADLAEQAAKKLDEAAAQLNQKAQQANQQVMLQQMYELASALEKIIMDQQAIMPGYEQLAQLQQSTELGADFVLQSRALVQKQIAVRESLRKLLPSTEQLQVFYWVLQQAESDLTRAVAAAERNRHKPEAANAADAGLRKLQLANESLASNPNESTANDPSNQEDQDNQESPQDDSDSELSLPPLASLKLVRALQLELKEQTKSLEGDSNRRSKILELTRQQQELGELLERLIADAQAQQEPSL